MAFDEECRTASWQTVNERKKEIRRYRGCDFAVTCSHETKQKKKVFNQKTYSATNNNKKSTNSDT